MNSTRDARQFFDPLAYIRCAFAHKGSSAANQPLVTLKTPLGLAQEMGQDVVWTEGSLGAISLNPRTSSEYYTKLLSPAVKA
jgi:hypothetical protein